MPDYQYTFVALGVHKDSHTARLAVLWPIIGHHTSSTVQGQLFALQALLGLWRDRITELYREKWPKLMEHRRRQYTRNCLPTMAEVREATGIALGKECKLTDICPWCYSRRIIHVFRKAKKQITGAEKLIYVRSEHLTHFDVKPTVAELRQLLSHARTRIHKLALANSKPCQGICWTVSLAPDSKDAMNVYTVVGLVAVLPSDETFDLVPDAWTFKEYTSPTQDDISEAVSRAFHYPVGLIKGDAEMMVKILDARDKLRLSDSYGCFRGV